MYDYESKTSCVPSLFRIRGMIDATGFCVGNPLRALPLCSCSAHALLLCLIVCISREARTNRNGPEICLENVNTDKFHNVSSPRQWGCLLCMSTVSGLQLHPT